MNTMTTTKTEALLRDAAQTALLTLDGIADASPRDKDSFETPADWIAWAKSRARFAADALREPIARELHAERVLRQMLDGEAATRPAAAPDTVPRDAWDALERERDYWRIRARTMVQHAAGEVWYWQGDGEDHLESLVNSLPVVIRADQLRELLAAAAPAVPDGFALVPVEASLEMALAGADVIRNRTRGKFVRYVMQDVWAAMLAAAQAKGAGHD